MSTNNVTDVGDDVEIPEAEPLPPLDAAERQELAPRPASADEPPKVGDDQEDEGEPPPLPPLLETGASTLATAGSGIYAATGPAGLVAAAGIATVAGVAYGFSRARAARAAAAGVRPGRGAGGRGGRFFGSGSGGLAGRTARGGAGRGLGRGARGGAVSRAPTGQGGARARHRASLGGRAGSSRTGAGHSGGVRRGGSRSPGSGGNLFGGGASFAGRRGSGPSRGGIGGLFGGTGSSRGRSSGGHGSGGRGGGLFGPSAGSTARAGRRRSGRGRSTSIIDPAGGRSRVGASRGRLRRGLRAGWSHPRVRRARAITRRGWSRGRIRVRDHTKRLSSYLRKRKWVLRARGWGRGLRDLFGRWWGALISRASDPRYGRLRGWELGVAAAAIGALGAGKKKSEPRVLTGRIIGTAAPTPGDDGPIAMAGRMLLALTTGETEGEAPLAPEVQRVRDAADDLRQALSDLGGSQVGMLAYEQGLKELGPTLQAVADGLRQMGTTAEDEQPLDGAVLEFFGVISDAARGASEVAEEMPGLFRAAHEVELQRLEAPRRGEHKWDISQQD